MNVGSSRRRRGRIACVVFAGLAVSVGAAVQISAAGSDPGQSRLGAQPRAGNGISAPAVWTTVWVDDFGGASGQLPASRKWMIDLGRSYPGIRPERTDIDRLRYGHRRQHSHQRGRGASDEEERSDGDRVQNRDALVIARGEP